MTIGERIKQLRKDNKLTQDEFATRLMISGKAISKLETGISNPSDQTVTLICREFHIRESWLRTGEGIMRDEQSKEDALWKDLTDIMTAGNDDFRKRLISLLVQMPLENWRVLEDMATELMMRPENAQSSPSEGDEIHA